MRPILRDGIRRKLFSHGVSREKVSRLERELGHHFEEAVDEMVENGGLSREEAERRAAERIGSNETLYELILHTGRQNNLWRMHPLLTFGVVPFLIFAVLPPSLIRFAQEVVIPAVGPILPAKAVGGLVVSTYCLVKYLLPLVTTGLFCLLARRLKCGPGAVGWAVLAATAVHLFTYIEIGSCPSTHILFGLNSSPPILSMMSPSLLAYILIPVAAGSVFILWNGFHARALGDAEMV